MRMNLTLKRFIKFALYLIWISTVVVIGLVYIRQGNIDNFKVASNNVDSDAPSFTGVEIYLTIPNVDLKKYDYNIHFEWKYKLNGTLVEKPGRNLTIDFDFGDKTYKFGEKDVMSAKDSKRLFSGGDETNFPFDSFWDEFNLQITDKNTSEPIPIAIYLTSALLPWSISFEATNEPLILTNADNNNTRPDPLGRAGVDCKITLHRTYIAKLISAFVFIMMWLLSFFIAKMAYNAYLLKSVGIREVTSCTSLLFAIPKFREIQPGIPGVGCLIDIVGFNWNISMIAVSGVVLLILYVHDMEKRVKMMEVVVGGGGGGDDHMKPDVVPVRPAGRDPIKDKHANEDYFCHNIC